jgi:hypothetical protein
MVCLLLHCRFCSLSSADLSLSLMLPPMVNRPVSLGIKHPSVAYNQILLPSDSCGFVDVGFSLWREDGFNVYNCCWPSPAQSFSCPSPLELATIFYCVRFDTSFFVASSDIYWSDRPRSGYIASGRIDGKHLSFPYPWIRLFITQRRVGFQESFSKETCLPTRSLAIGLHVTIFLIKFVDHNECYIVYSMFKYSSDRTRR